MASDSKTKILREGERYVQQGKISQAINEYLKILKVDPEDVLTLNTIGDLYLRQGRVGEANKIFLQVADSYTRNNFLLKAIAVYKKVLNSDPNNLEVNMLLASLYARQGMNVDARAQYMMVAELYSRQGKTSEAFSAYEKVVEIDPMNAGIQLKLAETYLEQDSKEKAHLYFAGAARAQMKSGDIPAAMTSFQRALAINLASSDALRGFLETALQADDLRGALDQVKESIKSAPDDVALREVLGRAYLAAGDGDRAEQYFLSVLDADESRYEYFLPLCKVFLENQDPDRALHCLDRIVPVAINQRQTEKLVEAYEEILGSHPSHIETLQKLAEIFSATNDEARYVATLEKIAQHYHETGNDEDALETLERVLQITPDNARHLKKHREIFELAYPGRLYIMPRAAVEAAEREAARSLSPGDGSYALGGQPEENAQASLVEIDLLLNYGMKEKALQLLKNLEQNSALDKDMRLRLISLYRETGESLPAAEQLVLLSVSLQKGGDPDGAQRYLAEAERIAPDWVRGLNVAAFAAQRGISLEAPRAAAPDKITPAAMEVDLSGDLSEIFFKDEPPRAASAEIAPPAEPGMIAEEFPSDLPVPATPESIEEQLQEVDFYIRLGFNDEARTKLEELAAAYPGHPELAPRYQQLGIENVSVSDLHTIPFGAPEPSVGSRGDEVPVAAEPEYAPPEADLEAAAARQEILNVSGEDLAAEFSTAPEETTPVAKAQSGSTGMAVQSDAEFQPNAMFADLMAEVNSLTNQEILREDFETHFNMGIAYREMSLLDEAIKEFQSAMKALDPASSPKDVIRCCGMLSMCFLAKAMPRSAMRWCQTGLNIKDISSHETIALRYDMGVAHSAAGETDRALECFVTIFGIDPGYRDVAQRIDELKSGLERHAP